MLRAQRLQRVLERLFEQRPSLGVAAQLELQLGDVAQAAGEVRMSLAQNAPAGCECLLGQRQPLPVLAAMAVDLSEVVEHQSGDGVILAESAEPQFSRLRQG